MCDSGTTMAHVPRRAGNAEVYYKRPAGAFPGWLAMEPGTNDFMGMYNQSILHIKPYVPYTFNGFAHGTEGIPFFRWDVPYYDEKTESYDYQYIEGEQDLKFAYSNAWVDVPRLTVTDSLDTYTYQMISNYGHETCSVFAWPDWGAINDHEIELLKSSIDFSMTSDNGSYPFTLYSGMTPYGSNEYGWWFGKNSGSSRGIHADGIAQAFEKPEHPYLLKQVVLMATRWTVTSNVDMKCKIYRLNDLPDYDDSGYVFLPDAPGELIAVGVSHLTPLHVGNDVTLIPFTLSVPDKDNPELLMELPITIEDPILVAFEGYNDPEMSALENFTAMIGNEFYLDDGFGERAYIKVGKDDAYGHFDGHYQWQGLNNFFTTGIMKTGFSIFLTTDQPFLVSTYTSDDYEYIFPATGGVMEKTMTAEDGEDVTVRSIEIASWLPTQSGDWSVTCNGEKPPAWLNFEFTDGNKSGNFSYIINALVSADALETDIDYREAVVRFAIPGAHMDYKFIQTRQEGEEPSKDYWLQMADAYVAPGDTIIIPVAMNNEGDVVAFQTDIKLPEGFEMVSKDGKFSIELSDRASNDHTVLADKLPNGKIHVQCSSPSNTPFTDNEGDLFYMTVMVPWSASGDNNTIQLWNTRLTLGDLTEYSINTVATAILSVKPYIPGDVNGDGEITVADANTVIIIIVNGGGSSGHSHIPNPNGEGFINLADINGDGEVSIADLNALIDLILSHY